MSIHILWSAVSNLIFLCLGLAKFVNAMFLTSVLLVARTCVCMINFVCRLL